MMRRMVPSSLVLALACVASLAVADVKETHVINDSGGTHALECTAERPEVALNGSDLTVAITGACTKVAVNGSSCKITIATVAKLAVNGSTNVIDIDTAGKIAVNGSDNKVTWKKAAAGKKPKVANLGSGNSVKKAP